MAGSIKGITVKIGGDTTGLDKALKGVNTQIRNTQSELKDVERLLKLDPTNTELLKQKQELLAKSVKDTSDKLKSLKEAEKQAQSQFKEGKISEEQYRALEREIIKTEQSLKTLESQAAKSNVTLNKIGNTAANIANKTKVVSTAAAGALVGIGTAATKFEDDFAKVSTLLDKSTVDYEKYKNSILEASSSTGIAAGEFSDATYQALSAGVAANDAVNFTTTAAKLAKGGMTDAASAVDIITTALNAYGMKASEAEHVSDVLVQIQNKGKTTVSELASNMGRAIPTANAYGVSLEQLGAAYSIITSKGVATAESTTYISAMLNELGKSGTKASIELQEATGQSFAQLMSDGKSLGDVIKILSERANQTGLSLNDMFGSAEAGKAALTLAADGAESFNNAVKGMEESAGTAQEAYEKIAGTPLEKAKKSLNQAKNSMIEAGANILPIVAKITEKISNITKALSELSPTTQKVILIIIAIVAAISPIAGLISGITTVMGALNAVMAANPVMLIVMAVAALIAIFVVLWNKCEGFRQFWINLWNGIKTTFLSVIDWFKGIFTETIPNIFNNLTNWLGNVFNTDWSTKFGALGEPLNAFFHNIKNIIGNIKNIFSNVIDFIKNVFSGNWSAAWENVKNIFKGIFDNLVNIFKIPINGVIGLLNAAITAINKLIGGLNKIKFDIPDWVPYLGGKTFGINIKEIGKIPYLARGGNVLKGTALVGEAGPELLTVMNGKTTVTPLNGNNSAIKSVNNTYNSYGASQLVNVFTVGNKEISRVIQPNISILESNRIYGRRRSGSAKV